MRLCEIVMSGNAIQTRSAWQHADSSWYVAPSYVPILAPHHLPIPPLLAAHSATPSHLNLHRARLTSQDMGLGPRVVANRSRRWHSDGMSAVPVAPGAALVPLGA